MLPFWCNWRNKSTPGASFAMPRPICYLRVRISPDSVPWPNPGVAQCRDEGRRRVPVKQNTARSPQQWHPLIRDAWDVRDKACPPAHLGPSAPSAPHISLRCDMGPGQAGPAHDEHGAAQRRMAHMAHS